MDLNQRVERGVVVRIAGDTLAYAQGAGGRCFAFPAEVIVGHGAGQSIADLGVLDGSRVQVRLNQADVVTEVRLDKQEQNDQRVRAFLGGTSVTEDLGKSEKSGDALRLGDHPATANKEETQKFLHPDHSAIGSVSIEGAIPVKTRTFGKLVDTSALRPGDLLLVRDKDPDDICKLITSVQTKGGYGSVDSQWTHAALYVGDGLNVVEATFDSVVQGGNVRLTGLDEYCQGTSILRFRRPRGIGTEKDGWRVAVRGLARLKNKYNFLDCIQMWIAVNLLGRDLGRAYGRRTSSAVICSALYADAYNEGTRKTLGEINGVCAPAWLSRSSEFQEVETGWLSII